MENIPREDLIEQIRVLQFRIKLLEKQLELIKEFYEE